MELINRLKQNFTINYHSYDGDIQYVRIPFKFLDICPNKCYLTCLLKYKNMYGYDVVDDYLLAWFHENLTKKSMKEKSKGLKDKGYYGGLWKIQNILCLGIRSDLVNEATRLPHGWVWVKSTANNNPHMRIVKFRFTDENFYKINDDDVGVVTTFNFYNNRFQKICEIKELEPRTPFKEAVAKALGLRADNKKLTKIINKSIRKAKSDKTFGKIPAFKIDGLDTNKMYVQKERKINFIRKINTTEGFWEIYLDDEKIPSKVFNIKGYRLFCTGFPRPFIPPSIENNRWIRIFTSIETVGCTQAYDMWILQSDLKNFYKHMIISGEGRALVECLGLHVDNTSERVRAANIIQKFYKGNRKKKRQFNILSLFKRTTSIENPEEDYEDEESEDEWETNLDDINERIDKECKIMSKKLKKEKSEEERQMQLTIKKAIENDNTIITLKKNLQRVTSLHNSVSNRVNLINKYIKSWKKTLLGRNEKRYFHIWWFLCFGKKFFTHYKGDIVGGKNKFYKKDTAKYLAKGDMEFIFKDNNLRECLNKFQGLMKTIKSTLKIYRQSKVTEKIGYTNLTKKQKNQVVKSGGLFNKQDDIKKEYAYEDLENLINDSDNLENYTGIGGGGSYADALSLLKNLPDIKTCCIQIVEGLKEVVIEKEIFIKGYLKDINDLNDDITIQKEFIKNSYK